MSEQAKILAEMQALVMGVLKTGTVTQAEGDRIDELEALMLKQKCYTEIENSQHEYLGEEIATLFFNEQSNEAINTLKEHEITPDDFFGFAEYHFEDEETTEMFTDVFIADINNRYQSK